MSQPRCSGGHGALVLWADPEGPECSKAASDARDGRCLRLHGECAAIKSFGRSAQNSQKPRNLKPKATVLRLVFRCFGAFEGSQRAEGADVGLG